MASYNYPYAGFFPAWPVKASCKPFQTAKTQEELALAPFTSLTMYYNRSGTEKDFQFWNFTESGDHSIWG